MALFTKCFSAVVIKVNRRLIFPAKINKLLKNKTSIYTFIVLYI